MKEKIIKIFRSKPYIFLSPLIFGTVSGLLVYYSNTTRFKVVPLPVASIIVGSIVTLLSYSAEWINYKNSSKN